LVLRRERGLGFWRSAVVFLAEVITEVVVAAAEVIWEAMVAVVEWVKEKWEGRRG